MARTLAATGSTVLLLDRSSFPRNNPCGGAISVIAHRLGLNRGWNASSIAIDMMASFTAQRGRASEGYAYVSRGFAIAVVRCAKRGEGV